MPLQDYLVQLGVSQAEFARELGVSRETIRGWCRGDWFPTLLHVSEIERLTGGMVRAASFYPREETEICNG